MCSAVSSGCAGDIILKRKFSVRLVVSEREREKKRESTLYTLIKFGVQSCAMILYLYFSVTDEDTVKRYYAKFEEKFFQTCEKELAKINTFYSGNDCNQGPFTQERFRVKTVQFCHISAG